MLKRKIFHSLKEWKNRSNHKSLIVTGQRQIGKTYVVDKMFSKEYKSYIPINFIEEPSMIGEFEGDLDVETLKLNIQARRPGVKFIEGDTLILFDEIQECPNAIASLKFWTEDGRFDVIGMGSSLGMNYMSKISYPVGKVEYLNMYSLDFEEYLWAEGLGEDVIKQLQSFFNKIEKMPKSLMDTMFGYLRKYMVIGGMPEVVNTYIETKDLHLVDEIQRRLIRDYRTDIARFADANIRVKAQQCYDSIPYQLTKDNHKFQYSKIESKATAAKFGTSIGWLNNQLLTIQVNSLKRIDYPLESFSDETNFRIYPTDIGILVGMYDESLKKALLEDASIEEKPAGLVLGTAKGALYEALAAEMLYKRGYDKLFFYKHEKSTSEVEFVITKGDELLPIEIKAGRKQANSLRNILESNAKLNRGYKMASLNIGQSDKIVSMPMFMLMFM
ncbi:MAG: AAA family ATPase [Pseudobutyrivibrio sp.]|nr:AAA family ATPase [Pseudobutyrivibrio sp.]